MVPSGAVMDFGSPPKSALNGKRVVTVVSELVAEDSTVVVMEGTLSS